MKITRGNLNTENIVIQIKTIINHQGYEYECYTGMVGNVEELEFNGHGAVYISQEDGIGYACMLQCVTRHEIDRHPEESKVTLYVRPW